MIEAKAEQNIAFETYMPFDFGQDNVYGAESCKCSLNNPVDRIPWQS